MQILSPDGRSYELIARRVEHRSALGRDPDLELFRVGETSTARLYMASQPGMNRSCLLQVAIDARHNGTLDRMAYVLRELRAKALEVEAAFEPHRKLPEHRLNYQLGFPEVVESFLFREQGNRRINVLAFECADDVRQLVPLANIVEKDKKRVDLKTSAWIIGKLLKLLAFAHDCGFAMGRLDLSGVLIVPEQHYVVLFDWSEAITYPGGVPAEVSRGEIMAAAQAVITLLGGDRMTRRFPDDGAEDLQSYAQHLLELAAGSRTSAEQAHAEFYKLIRRDLGWKGFHPFTILDR